MTTVVVNDKEKGNVSTQNNQETKTILTNKEFAKEPNNNYNSYQEPYQRKNIFEILKISNKYYNYIVNKDYYSDVNIKDLNNSDVSDISDIEEKDIKVNFKDGFDEELLQYQDYEKVFQQKLLNLYVQDVSEAKNFYYKEKVKACTRSMQSYWDGKFGYYAVLSKILDEQS